MPPASTPPVRVPAWQLAVLVVCMAGAAAHQLGWLSGWIIDDAAISFAYARNLAHGEGPVPFPGGEWVEGYSNPTWVALLAVASALGADAFPASQVLCVALGVLAVPLAWEVARRALPSPTHPAALVAAAAVAWNSQHAIWGASRLENTLFTALLLGGTALLLREQRSPAPRFPWSAATFAALALTRPEGPMYAALAAAWALAGPLHARAWRPALTWLAVLAIPVGVALAARYAVFAWPFPNTYYAKLGTTGSQPFAWGARGWSQVREFTAELGWSALVPVLLVGGAARTPRARLALYVALFATAAALLLFPGPDAFRAALGIARRDGPAWWPQARVGLLLVAGFGLPVASLGAPGGTARGLSLHFAAAALLFAVVSDGDWMEGYRWMSLLAGPAAVLLAVGAADIGAGIDRLVDKAPDPLRAGLGSAVILPLLGLGPAWRQVKYTEEYAKSPEDYPEMVKRRVDHFQALQERLFLDDAVVLDMDMGGTLWWGDDRVVDLAGLVDVPIAHHDYGQRAFWREYLFQETRPHFAHLHRAWASRTRLTAYPEWKAQYVEVEGYREGRGTHDGIWLRRDVVFRREWAPATPGRTVDFGEGWALLGLDVPAPEVAPGDRVFVELGLTVGRVTKGQRPRLDAALVCGESITRVPLELGSGVVPIDEAHPGEIVVGRYAWPVPGDAAGPCTVALQFTGVDGATRPPVGDLPAGAIVPVSPGPEASPFARPVLGAAEVQLPGLVTVVSPEERDRLVAADVAATLDAASAGRCADATTAWNRARRRAPAPRPELAQALAACFAHLAAPSPPDRADTPPPLTDDELAVAVPALEAARRWDHRSPALRAARGPTLATLQGRGATARAEGDWPAAYDAYSAILRVDPTDAWARRYAEEARDHRLGLPVR